jgi:hypothetical protein
MQALEQPLEITNFLVAIRSKYGTIPVMAALTDAFEALQQELKSRCERAEAIREEKKQYADAYLRYVTLDKEQKENTRQLEELAGIMGTDLVVRTQNENTASPIMDVVEDRMSMDTMANSWRLRTELPLWKAIKWYVGHAGETRINDILSFLEALGFEGANRNSVESALRVHPDDFIVKKRKNEKYISLKGV